MANVLWVRIGGNRYAFSYDHEDGAIEMRAGSTQGAILNTFSNTTTNREIKDVFGKL